MCQRRQRAHCAVGSAAGIPRPLHQRFFFVMFEQAWTIEIVIPRAVGQLTADGGTRKCPVVDILPTHLERREVPVVTTGNAGAIGIRFLVTTGAIQSRDALVPRTSHDIRPVALRYRGLVAVAHRPVVDSLLRCDS